MNRSSKIFLIVSGLYLFLLFITLLIQPKSGYSPSFFLVLFKIMLFIPLGLVIYRLILLNKKRKFINEKVVFTSLIILILIGFIFNLDYLRQSGCYVENESYFSSLKFILSGESILLLFSGYFTSSHKIGIGFLMFELFFWSSKSLYYNSSLDLFLPGYFVMTGWMFRVVLITEIFNKRSMNNSTKL